MLSEYKTALPLRTANDAEPEAKSLLEAAQKKMGFVPNMYQAMANSSGLLNTYIQGYDAFRANSKFGPAEQEVVLLAISRTNGCEYCVAAHSFLAGAMSGVPDAVTTAIRDGASVPDIKLNALSNFSQLMVTKRGLPDRVDVEAFLSAGYEEKDILEIILAIAVKTISNYTNHIFHTEVDEVFTKHTWSEPQHMDETLAINQ